ncbi:MULTISPECIES: hypothetical protein [unclassified Caballeronia]|uniref:hypothetical protein n=1 Tax=unclassified Caballeronia TaxID=2646786 RepID=UPI002027CB4B|nr:MULTISPECIES: hypothetical protein [unclassified Caballeronia]MDR5765894.1 hypothetical protein [Caballeronia sp. LZ028]
MPQRSSQEKQSERCASATEQECSVTNFFAEPEFPDHLKRSPGYEKHGQAGCEPKPIIPSGYAFPNAYFMLFGAQLETRKVIRVLRVMILWKIFEYVHSASSGVATPV